MGVNVLYNICNGSIEEFSSQGITIFLPIWIVFQACTCGSIKLLSKLYKT